MAQSAVLKVEKREKKGTNASRRLRAQGRIPANIQSPEGEHLDIALDEHEFTKARRHHVHLYDLDLGGGQVESAVVREIQWDALGEHVLHVEFKRVVRGVETEAEVELEFFGHPAHNGLVNTLLTHLTIRTLPSKIPDKIEVSVEGMEPGHHIKARDITLPEGVSLAVDPDTDVATISGAHLYEEEEPSTPEGEPSAEGEAPEAGEDRASDEG